jgi:uncharacterized protein YjbI with pentapeptide repeats
MTIENALKGTYLSAAHLEGAEFHHAHLEGAHFFGAHLKGAQLGATDLSKALDLTREQVADVQTDTSTIFPWTVGPSEPV